MATCRDHNKKSNRTDVRYRHLVKGHRPMWREILEIREEYKNKWSKDNISKPCNIPVEYLASEDFPVDFQQFSTSLTLLEETGFQYFHPGDHFMTSRVPHLTRLCYLFSILSYSQPYCLFIHNLTNINPQWGVVTLGTFTDKQPYFLSFFEIYISCWHVVSKIFFTYFISNTCRSVKLGLFVGLHPLAMWEY